MMRMRIGSIALAGVLALTSLARADNVLVQPWNMEQLRCAMPTKDARFLDSSAPGHLFYRGEPVDVDVSLSGKHPVAGARYAIEVQGIHTREPNKYPVNVHPFGRPDVVTLIGEPATHPIRVPAADGEAVKFRVKDLPVPETYGTYALILTWGDQRQFLGTVARVIRPREDGHAENTPILGEGALFHEGDPHEQAALMRRMGIRALRHEGSWSEREDGSYDWKRWDELFEALEANGMQVMVTLGAHPMWSMPFGTQTPAVEWSGSPYGGRADWLSSPDLYPRFGRWVEAFCRRYWKKGEGALWALEHYNEPWEGGGISGWARDTPQYRKLLKVIANAARKVSPEIRIAAASSVMNTEDKLFSEGPGPDGEYEMARYVDIFTDHYVKPSASYGPLVAAKHGKWSMETETWLVINEYLLPVTVCRFLGSGQRAIAPWHPKVVYDSVPGIEGRFHIPTTLPVANAAFNHFVTGRRFEKLVFTDHLPWVFQFGEDDDPEGLLVMFGQLLSAGGATPQDDVRSRPWAQVEAASGGTITIDNHDGLLRFYDLAGNPVHEGKKEVTLPMTFLPAYIRCDRGPAAAAERLRQARIKGKRPVEILPRDFTGRVSSEGLALEVEVTNRLNRAIEGTLRAEGPEGVRLGSTEQAVALEPGEGRVLSFPIAVATPAANNAYPFAFEFTSDAGSAEYSEVLNAAVIHRRTITVDGDLGEWAEVPGVTVVAGFEKVDPTERARRPWKEWADREPDGSFAELRLAWDDTHLYIAATVNDPTPQFDKQRVADRDEDTFFHDASSDEIPRYAKFLEKHPGRSFSEVPYVYRKSPNTAQVAPWHGDRLQIGLNVRAGWHDLDPTTDRVSYGFHSVPDTDYSFSLYGLAPENAEAVAEVQQALTETRKQKQQDRMKTLEQELHSLTHGRLPSELWRMLAPGVPRMHDFPRQPRGQQTTGTVPGARHVVRQDGNVRTYELALPHDQVPDLRFAPGQALKPAVRIGNNQGPSIFYGQDKAVTKDNGLTLKPYWHTSPSAEIEWTMVE